MIKDSLIATKNITVDKVKQLKSDEEYARMLQSHINEDEGNHVTVNLRYKTAKRHSNDDEHARFLQSKYDDSPGSE